MVAYAQAINKGRTFTERGGITDEDQSGDIMLVVDLDTLMKKVQPEAYRILMQERVTKAPNRVIL